jgi:hypothetical protein
LRRKEETVGENRRKNIKEPDNTERSTEGRQERSAKEGERRRKQMKVPKQT